MIQNIQHLVNVYFQYKSMKTMIYGLTLLSKIDEILYRIVVNTYR